MSDAVDLPRPSSVRRIVLDARGNSYSRLSRASTLYRWPPKHPLDNNWWWVDATRWCKDVGDTVGQLAYSQTLTDPSLSISKSLIWCDGFQAGLLLTGGTPGTFTSVRVVLTGARTLVQQAVDITLPIENVSPAGNNPAGEATLNHSYVTIGGIPFPLAQVPS